MLDRYKDIVKTGGENVSSGKVLKYKLRAEHADHYRDVDP